jgi:dienelactone hydrolase
MNTMTTNDERQREHVASIRAQEYQRFERYARRAADAGNEIIAVELYQMADTVRTGAGSYGY